MTPAGLVPAVERRALALRGLTFATAFWALSFPTMKALVLAQHQLLGVTGSWFLSSLCVFYRFGIAGLVMGGFLLFRRAAISRLEIEEGLVLALFGGLGILLQMDGLAYTPASTSAFLTQAYCVFIPLWLALVQRRFPARKPCVCVALVVAGVWVLAGLDIRSLHLGRGEYETLLASVLFTGQILALEQPRYAGNRAARFTTVMFLAMAALCLPVVALTAPSLVACGQVFATTPTLALLAVLVFFCTLGAYNFMNTWQPHVSATEAGLIYCLEPVLASVLALWVPGWLSRWTGVDYPDEVLTTRLLVGGGLITVANILLQSPWLESRSRPATV